MKLTLMSDLHLEFWEDPNKLIQNVVDLTPPSDIIALAGDIGVLWHNYEEIENLIVKLAAKGKVVFVPGNHCYYGQPFERGDALLRNLRSTLRFKDVVINLGPPEWVQEGEFNILVGTGWFPDLGFSDYDKSCLSDFKVKNLENFIYDYNDQFMRMLEKTDKKNIITISHHSPTFESIAPKYRGSTLNRFFCNKWDPLLEDKEVLLACHGHLHDAVDYNLGCTRVLSNPMGYPTEMKLNWAPKVIEI